MCSLVCNYGEYNFSKSTYIIVVGFFIVIMNMLFSHSRSIHSETYYINGLTVNVYVPSYFNGVKRC